MTIEILLISGLLAETLVFLGAFYWIKQSIEKGVRDESEIIRHHFTSLMQQQEAAIRTMRLSASERDKNLRDLITAHTDLVRHNILLTQLSQKLPRKTRAISLASLQEISSTPSTPSTSSPEI